MFQAKVGGKFAYLFILDNDGDTLVNNLKEGCWTEYCSGLYNYELHPDISQLQSNQTLTWKAESLPVLREEV